MGYDQEITLKAQPAYSITADMFKLVNQDMFFQYETTENRVGTVMAIYQL